jgi:hypothetical protein
MSESVVVTIRPVIEIEAGDTSCWHDNKTEPCKFLTEKVISGITGKSWCRLFMKDVEGLSIDVVRLKECKESEVENNAE